MGNWAQKLKSVDTSIFLKNDEEENDFKSITKREKITSSEGIIYSDKLSSIEQHLLARNYTFGNDLSEYIWIPKNMDVNNLTPYLKHFNLIRYLYSNNELKFIQIGNPKESSINQFSKIINDLHPFVKGLYFSPDENLKKKDYSIITPAKVKREMYTLDSSYIKKLNSDEQVFNKELIDFITKCYPNFRTEPDRILFDENILCNFAIRLLVTLFEKISFIVESESKRIILLGVSN